MHTYPEISVCLDHNMKLYKMIEIYLKYDNMHTYRVINAFIRINNHENSCINSILSLPLYCHDGIVYLDVVESWAIGTWRCFL